MKRNHNHTNSTRDITSTATTRHNQTSRQQLRRLITHPISQTAATVGRLRQLHPFQLSPCSFNARRAMALRIVWRPRAWTYRAVDHTIPSFTPSTLSTSVYEHAHVHNRLVTTPSCSQQAPSARARLVTRAWSASARARYDTRARRTSWQDCARQHIACELCEFIRDSPRSLPPPQPHSSESRHLAHWKLHARRNWSHAEPITSGRKNKRVGTFDTNSTIPAVSFACTCTQSLTLCFC